jgi:hypothetical protein
MEFIIIGLALMVLAYRMKEPNHEICSCHHCCCDRHSGGSTVQQSDFLWIKRQSSWQLDNEQLRTEDILRIQRRDRWQDTAIERRDDRVL